MSDGLSPGRGPQSDRLAQALREHRISRLELARLMNPPTATKAEVQSTKTQIAKWVKGKPGISDENAERIAAAFNSATGTAAYDPDYFKKDPDAPRSWHDEMRVVAQATMEERTMTYQQEMQRLRDEVDDLRRQEEERHREVLEAIRDLRAS